MIELKDLTCYDDLYYVGHIVDLDGNDWVDKQTAEDILKLNSEEESKIINETKKLDRM